MSQQKFYVYVHYRADSLALFYVGKGGGNRYKDTFSRNRYWRNVVNKHGFVTQILHYFDNETDAFNCEKYLIKKFRDDGLELTNLTDGGEGSSGHKTSEETKAKLSKANKGRKMPPMRAEHKAKLRAARTGKKATPDARAKISAANKGKIMRAESREKMSKAIEGEKSHHFKGAIIATNTATGEQLRLLGRKEIDAANFHNGTVYACVLGKEKQHKGFTFIREEIVSIEGKEAC